MQASKNELFRVDVTLPTAFARAARAANVRYAGVLTAVGTDITASYSWVSRTNAGGGWYNHVKGQVEKNTADLGFPAGASMFRPSALLGSSHTPWIVAKLMSGVSGVLPAKYKPISVSDVGAAMAQDAVTRLTAAEPSGETAIYEGNPLFELARAWTARTSSATAAGADAGAGAGAGAGADAGAGAGVGAGAGPVAGAGSAAGGAPESKSEL